MKHVISKQHWLALTVAAAELLTAPMWANAMPLQYTANFTSLNDSGVTGAATLTLDNHSLTVNIAAQGLALNQPHPMHIHGTFDASGNPTDATTPTLAVDANHDGVIELGEGAGTYGAILLPLTPFPTAPDGTINYSATFDLTNASVFAPGYSEQDLLPLTLREIVIHGMVTPVPITDNLLGQSYAAGDYDPVFPVASAEIVAASASAVPEPLLSGMMTLGLGLLLSFLLLRRRVGAGQR